MISVIVAAYNCGESIGEALESVLSQTLPDEYYRVIVVNDGSTDNTVDILNKYKGRIDVIHQSNQGLVAAYNRGIREAKGDYVIRLDADDYFDKKMLSLTLQKLEAMPDYHYIYTNRYEVDALRGTEVEVKVGQDNIFNMIGCGILFRREVFDKVGLYRDLLFEEYDLMLRLSDNGIKGYYLPQPLYYYVKHEANMTSQQRYWENGWKQLVELWGEEKLKKYVDIQMKLKGTSRLPPV